MTPLDTLAPFHRAVSRQLRAAPLSVTAPIGIAAVITLALYCLGHAALTVQPLAPELTVLWSLAHGAGIVGLVGGAAVAARRRPGLAFWFSLGGGLLGSLLIFWIGSDFVADAIWHHYASVTVYIVAAGVLAWILWPRTPPETLTVDFGRARQRISIERVVAARGARNYAELSLAGDDRTGLVRSTLSALEKRFSGELVRTQRSWLVNPRHVAAIRHARRGALVLEMTGGLEVPVSATRAEALLRDPRFVPGADVSSQRPGRDASTA